MKAPTQEYKRVEKLNDLLRQELGYPPYSWQWSEDLIVRMRDREYGYDYYANPETRLIELKPKWIDRTVCAPMVVNQWVLCRLITTDKRAWLAQFADDMEWPENGRWSPCNGPGGYVALPPQAVPDKERTWQVIRMVRETQAESLAQLRARLESGQRQKEADTDAARREFLEEAVPKLLAAPQNTIYSFGADAAERKEVSQ